VLADQVARRCEDHDVASGGQDRVDGDAQHHLRLARAGRRLEQKLEGAVVEAGGDGVDRFALVGGELEGFSRLDEFVGQRDALTVLIDRLPHVGGDEFGCG